MSSTGSISQNHVQGYGSKQVTFYGCHGISSHCVLLFLSATLGILRNPLHQRVMHQSLQYTQQSVSVCPQHLQAARAQLENIPTPVTLQALNCFADTVHGYGRLK